MTNPISHPNGLPHALPHKADPMAFSCHVTGRYGTERKSSQDPDENSRFPDRSAPVDNRESIVEEVA